MSSEYMSHPHNWYVLILSALRQRSSGVTMEMLLLALDEVTSSVKFGKILIFAYSVKFLRICSFSALKESKIL